MKLTAKQHENIARGIRNIAKQAKEARMVIYAYDTFPTLSLLIENNTGTFYSKRFKK